MVELGMLPHTQLTTRGLLKSRFPTPLHSGNIKRANTEPNRIMTSFSPHSANHAIEQAVIGIRLLEDADEERYAAALQIAVTLAEKFDLPGRLELDPMALMFGRQALTMGFRTSTDVKSGTVFQRVNKRGLMESELTVERSAITFRTRDYDRWSTMQRFAQGLVAPVGSALCGGSTKNITAIELRCIDKFISTEASPPLTDLVDDNTPLLANWLKSKTDFLHSHIGWFENVSENGRTLINLNLDLSGQAGQRVATILQVISLQSNGKKSSFYGKKGFENMLVENLNILHKRDKSIVGSLLKDDVKFKISLDGNSGVSAL